VARFLLKALQAITQRHPPAPETFVETGTWIGNTTRLAREHFKTVHTIELSQDLYDAHSPGLTALGVQCHHGDTRDVLPRLAAQLKGPVFWFLDAHATDQCAGAVSGPLPLFDELQVLAQRQERDVVVVDDVHCFITHRAAALKERPQRAVAFKANPEWNLVSLAKIASFFPGYREAIILGDQGVVYR